MKSVTSRIVLAVAVLGLVAGATGQARAGNLVVDGGFEPPNPTTTPNLLEGGYVGYFIGNSFGGPNNDAWTVVQLGGGFSDVAVTPTTEYANSSNSPFPKTYFNGNSGLQWLDLTGDYDNGVKMGVQQTLATTLGGQYLLSFYVGSFNSVPAPVELDINGASVGTFTNNMTATFPSYNGDGVAGMTWQQFTYDFAATGASTTIAFYNLAPGGVLANGLDDVSVSAVPEPSSFVLASIASLIGLGCTWCRRQAKSAACSACSLPESPLH